MPGLYLPNPEAHAMPKPKPKPLRVVLNADDVEIVAYADDAKAALEEAINLLALQTKLEPGLAADGGGGNRLHVQ
jgi:hypothetical protein